MKIWRPEVEHVTRGRSPSLTSSTEGRLISMSHERLCVICFVVWPTTFAYDMAAFLTVLPIRWQRGRFAYKMAVFLRVLPTRWRSGRFAYKIKAMPRFWEFYPQDAGVGVLPTRWRRQPKRKQKQRRINITFAFRERKVYCRPTNYELLRWLVETPSRNFEHYRMSGGRLTCRKMSDGRLTCDIYSTLFSFTFLLWYFCFFSHYRKYFYYK